MSTAGFPVFVDRETASDGSVGQFKKPGMKQRGRLQDSGQKFPRAPGFSIPMSSLSISAKITEPSSDRTVHPSKISGSVGEDRIRASGKPSSRQNLSGKTSSSSTKYTDSISGPSPMPQIWMDRKAEQAKKIQVYVDEVMSSNPEAFTSIPEIGKEPDFDAECSHWIFPQARADEELKMMDRGVEQAYLRYFSEQADADELSDDE